MSKSYGRLALPVVAMLLAGSNLASANTFEYSSYSVANEQTIQILTPNNIYGGIGQVVLNGSGPNAGQQLPVWCLDVYEYLTGSGMYDVQPLTTAGSGGANPSLSSLQINEIGSLMVHGDALIHTSYDVSAAIQLAIWQVEYSNFTFSGLNSTVAALASTYLSNVAPSEIWGGNYDVVLLTEAGNQHMGTAAIPIPLPSTWTMMLATLACLSLMGYRRRIRESLVGA
jgi:hypothetical protein